MKRDETSTLEVTVNEKLEFTSFRAEFDYDDNGFEITSIDKGEILPDTTELFVIKNDQDKIIRTRKYRKQQYEQINCSY